MQGFCCLVSCSSFLANRRTTGYKDRVEARRVTLGLLPFRLRLGPRTARSEPSMVSRTLTLVASQPLGPIENMFETLNFWPSYVV